MEKNPKYVAIFTDVAGICKDVRSIVVTFVSTDLPAHTHTHLHTHQTMMMGEAEMEETRRRRRWQMTTACWTLHNDNNFTA